MGTEEETDDGVPFEDKMNAITTKLAEQFAKGAEQEKIIREKLKMIGYEFLSIAASTSSAAETLLPELVEGSLIREV